MDIEKRRQEIRLLISTNSSYNVCFSKISQYREYAIILNRKEHIAYADFYESKIQQHRGNLIKAVQLVKKNIPFFIETKNDIFLQSSYLALGAYKCALNNQEEALSFYCKAAEITSSLKQNKAIALNNISQILVNLKQYETAIKNINEGLETISLKDLNDRPLYYGMLLNLSNIFLLKNNFEKSLEILQKTERAQNKYPQDRIYGILHRNYGNYYTKLKQYESAIKHFDLCINYCEQLDFKLALLEVVVLKAKTLIEMNKINEAETLLKNKHTNYKNENATAYINLLCTLTEIYTLKKDCQNRQKIQAELDILTDF